MVGNSERIVSAEKLILQGGIFRVYCSHCSTQMEIMNEIVYYWSMSVRAMRNLYFVRDIFHSLCIRNNVIMQKKSSEKK